jgi:hypothetical protein
MNYLYGAKHGGSRTLVATFDSEQQLLAYVRWATLSQVQGVFKFEQGSALAAYQGWGYARQPMPQDKPDQVVHNPSPSML